LVVLLVVIAARLSVLWRWGKVGKAVVVVLMAAFLAHGVRSNVQDIRPRWMGLALKVDGRRYIEFLARAGNVFFATGRQRLEPALASMELNLPYEATLLDMANDMDAGRGLLEQVWQSDTPLISLRAFMRKGPAGGAKIDRYKAAGVTLARLYLQQKASVKQVAAFATSTGGRGAGTMMEALGAGVGQKMLEDGGLKALQSPAMKTRWLRRFARGLGRTTDLSTILHGEELVCSHEKLPAHLQGAYISGVGHGVARRLIAAVPPSVGQRLCPRARALFWAGVKQHGPPRVKVLPRAAGIDPSP